LSTINRSPGTFYDGRHTGKKYTGGSAEGP
jgi:hypothetical protein